MSQYNKSEWKAFRDQIIELDNYKCKDCSRDTSEVVLQVHHKKYIRGRKPWEYPLQDCETLCRGCHAARHGIIKPQIGWEYIGQEDLGDLIGICEQCNTPIRHTFLIQHEKWGVMVVGTYCCDKLTDTDLASNLIESQKSFESRKKRFLNSPRWKFDNDIHTIMQGSFAVEINKEQEWFFIKIHNIQSRTKYHSLIDAKATAFDVIESGTLIEYLNKNMIPLKAGTKRKILS